MKYGFLDEAGDVGYAGSSSTYLLIVIVVVRQPELLRKAVARTRRSLVKRLRNIPELKAARGNKRIVEKLLRQVDRDGFDAISVIIDKRRFPQPRNLEDLYRYACTQIVRETLKHFGPLSLTLDKRYTNPGLRQRLNNALATGVEDLGITLAIEHADSASEHALQVADAIAWSLLQKYEHQNERLWQIVKERVIEIAL